MNNKSDLLSGLILNRDIYNIIIEDYYDTSEWIGNKGCIGIMYEHHTCEWCRYLLTKTPDHNFKTIGLSVDGSNEELLIKIKNILSEKYDEFFMFDTTYSKTIVHERSYLRPTGKFFALKNLLISIGCTLDDRDIVQLNLGDIEVEGNVEYDTKLATVVDESQAMLQSDSHDYINDIISFDNKYIERKNIYVVRINIKMSTLNIKEKLQLLLT